MTPFLLTERAEKLLEEVEFLKGSGLKQADGSPRTPKAKLKLIFKDPSQGSTSPTSRSDPAPTRENVSDSSTDSQDFPSRLGSPGPSTVRLSSDPKPDNLPQHAIPKARPQPPGTPVNQIKKPPLRPPERRPVPDEDNGLVHHRNAKRKFVEPHPHLDNLPIKPTSGPLPPSFYKTKQQCLRKPVR
jgi:hypothetical protein